MFRLIHLLVLALSTTLSVNALSEMPPVEATLPNDSALRSEAIAKGQPAPYLEKASAAGASWANCIWDLARNVLDQTPAPYRDLRLDGYVTWQYSVGLGYWYTIRASSANGTSYDLNFNATYEAQTCRVAFYGHAHGISSLTLRTSGGARVLRMGRLAGLGQSRVGSDYFFLLL